MSAQAGVWNFDGKPVNQALLEKLGSSIDPFGPDGGDAYIHGSVGMVYRAFHTTLESRLERQPYISARGNVFTWDGRLDNRNELLPELCNDLTADHTDIAIVAAAFERWGTHCFRRVIGDWALSVWRPADRELIFAVDYMAIRHIFYYPKTDRIWWSSDLAPLVMQSGDNFRINDDYIAGYFARDPDAHLTPYREIQQVPPGHFVRVHDRIARVGRYWCFSSKSSIYDKTDADYEDHFRHLFRQSVRRRLRSDTPILAELSGGLDSSSMVCMADDIVEMEGGQARRLDTLSYYDKTEPNGDDWFYFQKVEEKRGMVGYHIDIARSLDSVGLEYLTCVPQPEHISSGLSVRRKRAELIRRHGYRVVLSGIGGDEFLGGNPDPRDQLADLIVQCKVVTLARQLIAWSLFKRVPWLHLLLRSSVLLIPPALGRHFIKDAKLEPWIDAGFAKRTHLAIRQLIPLRSVKSWLPTRQSSLDCVTAMSDKMARMRPPALELEEARYPYLDRDLVEFLISIPPSQLLRPFERRSLMRRSLRGLVPQEVLNRPTKGLAALTPTRFLEKHSAELLKLFDSPVISDMGYADRRLLVDTFAAIRNGKVVYLFRLLRAISIELWLRDIISRGLLQNRPAVSPSSTASKLDGTVNTTIGIPATFASKVAE